MDLSTGVARGQGHDRIVVAGQGLEVVGSDADDVLLGSDLGEWFEPGPGNDTVEAGAGDDRLVESREANGDDTYDLGAGADFVVTWRGHDRVDGGDGADYLSLRNPEASRVDGGAGDDRIERQAAPDGDVLAGGPGDDELTVDLVSADAEAAVLDIAAGSFVMGERMLTVADFERWTIQVPVPLTVYGSEERDVVTAPGRGLTDAPLTAYLFGGNDAAYAARADDYVDGGDGMDLAVLGSGTNTCVNVESDC